MTPTEREAFTPWPELVRIFERAGAGPTDLTPKEVALLAVYVGLDAPRRITDYQEMRIGREGSEMGEDRNWLVLDKAGKPVSMIWNVHKVSKLKVSQRLDQLPPDVVEALGTHIRDAGLSVGDPLFRTRAGAPYTPGAFSTLLGKTVEKATGRRGSVDALRHARVVHFLRKPRSVAEREALAESMGHSVDMQGRYQRLDAPGE